MSGAEHVHRPRILDRVEALDDDLLAGHGEGALGEADGDDHGQHLGRQTNRDGDGEEEGLTPVPLGQSVDREDQRHHHENEAGAASAR